MSTTYSDRTYLQIDGTIVECSSIDVSVEDGGEPVPTMNKENRAKGHKRGIVKYKLTAEAPMDVDSSVDFTKLLEDADELSAVIEHEGGATETYLDCRVSKVDKKSKEGDATTYSVDLNALDRVES